MKGFPYHRGWLILGITVLNLFACLGLGRFSLGAILPFMREGLSLSYTEAGIIASAVFLGYLAGAVSVGFLTNRFPTKKVIIVSLIISAAGMGASAAVNHFFTAFLAFLVIGLGCGTGNVASLSVVGKWFSIKYRGFALGVTNSGSSFGMLISGFLVPMLMMINTGGWRISWGILALLVVLIIIINHFFLVDEPHEIGLKPIGAERDPASEEGEKLVQPRSPLIENVYSSKLIYLIGITYFTWGFSYLIFSTFFVDFLITSVSLEPTLAGQIFATAGIASIASGFLWGALSDKIGRMLTLFIIYLIQTCLLIAFTVTTQPIFLFLETILYSLTLWAVPTIMVAAVSDLTAARKTSMAIGFITLFFGIGQWIAPMVTGVLVDYYNFTTAFYLSAAVCLTGSAGCMFLHLKIKSDKGTAASGLQVKES
ncbi:MFS transporter [Evansella clarkii]|uniref:MFS transporter n=1 Tax=Evansella clarkii TaxID=79879 RepID=UPI000B4442BB|nr:MFS transporter [Evansella clarkii]